MVLSTYTFRYMFISKADEYGHINNIDGGVWALNMVSRLLETARENTHKCPVYNQKYPTKYQVLKHQNTRIAQAEEGKTPSK